MFDKIKPLTKKSKALFILEKLILKQFKEGKVYIIDFEKNELKIVKLVSDENAK